MQEQTARKRIAGLDHSLPSLEIFSRLLFIPGGYSGRKLLQSGISIFMTGDAASVPGPFVQENRLHTIAKESVIQRDPWGGLGRTCFRPTRQGLPFRIPLRLPMLAARVERIAARFRSQGMHHQPAGQGIARLHHSLPGLEIFTRLLFVPRRRAGKEFL